MTEESKQAVRRRMRAAVRTWNRAEHAAKQAKKWLEEHDARISAMEDKLDDLYRVREDIIDQIQESEEAMQHAALELHAARSAGVQ